MRNCIKKYISFRRALALWVGAAATFTAPAQDAFTSWLSDGKANLSFRPRYEFGSIDGFEDSNAATLRTLLGYTTADWNGWSAKFEFTDTHALDDDSYNAAGLNGQGTKTVIADPETTELNQLFLAFKQDTFGATVGRQRYILDNARFIGNVGWRQNEQTFDAATVTFKPTDALTLKAAYLHHINRIFADARDFDSESVLLNAGFALDAQHSLGAYYYHLDFDGAVVTTDTYGGFATGNFKLNDGLTLDYRVEAAMQEQDGTGIETTYYHLIVGASFAGFNLKAGYEVLGSDDGAGVFLTPLATAHAFNGFADTYLNNGGNGGLRDLYFSAGTKLGKLSLTGIYHSFASDEGNAADGSEFDAVAVYPVTQKIKLLAKLALYRGDALADRERFVFEVTTSF